METKRCPLDKPCPCGSEELYRDCCADENYIYVTDGLGAVWIEYGIGDTDFIEEEE